MKGIFVSYRRQDAAGYAGRLYDRLASHFGAERVFMDVEGIEPGVDFVEAIERAVASCEVLIVIIGSEWLAADSAGKRRLDDPGDFVRIETAAALARNIRVVPVLVEDAVMPRADQLPPDLAPLARRQAVELSHKQWDATSAELIGTLERVLDGDKPPRARNVPAAPAPHRGPEAAAEPPAPAVGPRGASRYWAIGGTLALVAVAVGLYLTHPWQAAVAPVAKDDHVVGAPPTGKTAAPPAEKTAAPAAEKTAAPPAEKTAALPAEKTAAPPAEKTAAPPAEKTAAPPAEKTATPAASQASRQPSTPAPSREGEQTSVPPRSRVAESPSAPPPAKAPAKASAPPSARGAEKEPELALPRPAEKVPPPARPAEKAPVSVAAAPGATPLIATPPVATSPVATSPVATSPAATSPVATAPATMGATTPATPPSALPRVGDAWEYRLRSKWKTVEPRTYAHRVTAVSAREVHETMSIVASADNVAVSQSFTPDTRFVEWRAKGLYFLEFNPFLEAFEGLQNPAAVSRLPAMPAGETNVGDWFSRGRIIGSDSVTVPAGTFKALKLEIDSSRAATGSVAMRSNEPVRVLLAIWYAPDVKRVAKMVRTVFTPSGRHLDEDTYELVQYRVQ